jgi:hypothetical protein
VYDSITTDVFGFRNLSVGLFGMLKGRAVSIPTAYFDGVLWIERGIATTTTTTDRSGGVEGSSYYYYNVYTRED